MSRVSDTAALQYKTLNKTKGRAVWSTRVQIDKKQYPLLIQTAIKKNSNISIVEGEAVSFNTKKNKITEVLLRTGDRIKCCSLIITCGTFMNGNTHWKQII